MELSVPEFDFIRSIVQRAAAIELIDDKKYLVELRIGILAHREGFASAAQLVNRLKETASEELRRKVVDAMTTNETMFFRDHVPFELLRHSLLPRLLAQRAPERRLRLWSAASSTGQEAYSLAMLLHQHFPEAIRHWNLEILATDLSVSCLSYARQGLYNHFEVSRGLPASYLVRFFDQEGNQWRINPEVRRLVSFQELNLIEDWPSLPQMDVILLRNVLIYFSLETRRKILDKIRRQLKPDGYLILGRSESPHNIVPYFKRVEALEHDNCFQLC